MCIRDSPYFIVERSPAAQKIFDKMGATFGKLQKKIKSPKTIVPDWRTKQFSIQTDGQEALPLLSLNDDLSIDWDREGVVASGFTQEELARAVA
eukprot:2628617-Karenia_brevis.AAC.1